MNKIQKSILVVGTYPIREPRHGGQKRLHAIVEEYKKRFTSVTYVSVFFDGFYSEYSPIDIPLGEYSRRLVQQSPMTGDIICGEAIYSDPEVKKRFTEVVNTQNPDVIHIEQPYPYIGLKKLISELGISPKLVFGSQNVEGPMKSEILAGYGTDAKAIIDIENQITALEEDLSKRADLTIACTTADLAVHAKMGATNLALAPNGVDRPEFSENSVQYWRSKFHAQDVESTALFVGSAHPPNWAGFLSMVGKGLGFVQRQQRIVAAGSISDYFDREIKEDSLNVQDATFWLRAFSAGRLSEPKLQGIIAAADVILLPITEGGGSNLKTAEAIISGKKVVATSHALRSFEWFADFPGVWKADTKKDFQSAIIEAFAAPLPYRTKEQTQRAQEVLWQNCLKEMIEGVEKL